MATCSQCEVKPATYQVDSVVMCGGCMGDTNEPHNVRPLKQSRVGRVNLAKLQSFRRYARQGVFYRNYFAPLQVLAAAAIASPRPKRESFFARFRGSLNHIARRISSPARKG